MENTTPRNLLDEYEEAAVALFMDRFAEAEAEQLLAECRASEGEESFPEELDKRCRETIRKQLAKNKHAQIRKSLWNGAKRVAIVLLVFLCISSVLFVSVDAFREPILKLLEAKSGKYSSVISGNTSPSSKPFPANTVRDGKLAGMLPDTFQLTLEDYNAAGFGFTFYTNNAGQRISYEIIPQEGTLQLDTEQADVVEECQVLQHSGIHKIKSDTETLVWLDEVNGKLYLLSITKCPEINIFTIAEQLVLQN